MGLESARKYIDMAREQGLLFKRVDSPELKGDVALVVASDGAVEVKNRKVLDREKRLKQKGVSGKIIKNVGARLCPECWSELEEKAPEELINYDKYGLLDRLLGTECVCHK